MIETRYKLNLNTGIGLDVVCDASEPELCDYVNFASWRLSMYLCVHYCALYCIYNNHSIDKFSQSC